MGCHNTIKWIIYEEVGVLRIGLMHILYSIYIFYLVSFVIHVLSLDNLVDPLMYLSIGVMHCILAEPFYVCQTIDAWIRNWVCD